MLFPPKLNTTKHQKQHTWETNISHFCLAWWFPSCSNQRLHTVTQDNFWQSLKEFWIYMPLGGTCSFHSVVSCLGLEGICVFSPRNYFKLMKLILTLKTRSTFIFHFLLSWLKKKKDWKWCSAALNYFDKPGCLETQCCESRQLLDKQTTAESSNYFF